MQYASAESNSIQEELFEFLRSKLQATEGDLADIEVDLTALITSAVADPNPTYSLEDIKRGVVSLGLASKLDALSVISLLIDSSRSGVQDLLDLVGECGSPKEVTISVQEVLERLRIRLGRDDDGEDDDDSEGKCTLSFQIIRLLDLYSQAIPRLKLRKKSATETLASLFADLGSLFDLSTAEIDADEAEAIYSALSRLIQVAKSWSDAQAKDEHPETGTETTELLLKLLYDGVMALSRHFDFGLAQEKFYEIYPRLRRSTNVGSTSTKHAAVVEASEAALESLNLTLDALTRAVRPGMLQVLAYSWSSSKLTRPPPERVLERTLPLLIDAIVNAHSALDESLFILLSSLYPNDSTSESKDTTTKKEWSPTTITPLIDALCLLACAHPAPHMRLIAFRCVGCLLDRLTPLVHMQVLHGLLVADDTEDEGMRRMQTPMRVAAVALLKDAVVGALSNSMTQNRNPFASPLMLQTFGRVVLRPHPTDLFSQPNGALSMEEFEEMAERKRLVECLSFYYVLLSRDVENRTGVRNLSQIGMVERELLRPIQSQLDQWVEGGGETSMGIAALTTALERVSSAIEGIRSSVP